MKITSKILWSNRTGEGTSWFHPRACALDNPRNLFMTLQSIGGSDFYGALHQSISSDGGETWSDPVPVPGYQRKTLSDGISEGVCDVVNDYHAPTQTVLAIGHNVYYKDGALFDTLGDWKDCKGPRLCRYPVWGIRQIDGSWSERRNKLEIPGFEECSMYSCGCSQRLFLDEDQLLIPLTFGEFGIHDRHFCSVMFRYDGKSLQFIRRGNTLNLAIGRGLLEPSLTQWDSRFLVTLRAEDGHSYHAESIDGLNWKNLTTWEFDDGTLFKTSTTQQHFLELGGRLFLVYNRDDGNNAYVFRFRAPIYIAEINQDLKLVRSSEQIVLPKRDEDRHAAGMGNFQPAKLNETHGIVTVGEERGFQKFFGDTLCAYIEI